MNFRIILVNEILLLWLLSCCWYQNTTNHYDKWFWTLIPSFMGHSQRGTYPNFLFVALSNNKLSFVKNTHSPLWKHTLSSVESTLCLLWKHTFSFVETHIIFCGEHTFSCCGKHRLSFVESTHCPLWKACTFLSGNHTLSSLATT